MTSLDHHRVHESRSPADSDGHAAASPDEFVRGTVDGPLTAELARARQAARRNEDAERRDEAAEQRDRLAESREDAWQAMDDALRQRHPGNDALQSALALNDQLRALIARDRAASARDRAHAAEDRMRALASSASGKDPPPAR